MAVPFPGYRTKGCRLDQGRSRRQSIPLKAPVNGLVSTQYPHAHDTAAQQQRSSHERERTNANAAARRKRRCRSGGAGARRCRSGGTCASSSAGTGASTCARSSAGRGTGTATTGPAGARACTVEILTPTFSPGTRLGRRRPSGGRKHKHRHEAQRSQQQQPSHPYPFPRSCHYEVFALPCIRCYQTLFRRSLVALVCRTRSDRLDLVWRVRSSGGPLASPRSAFRAALIG